MFSFTRLGGADPILGVEMASTGEVACFGVDAHEAFLKAMVSTNFKIPKKSICLSISPDLLEETVHHVWMLHAMGYELSATKDTYPFFKDKGIPAKLIQFANSEDPNNIKKRIADEEIDLVVNLPSAAVTTHLHEHFLTRRTSVDFGVPLLTNPQIFKMFVEAMQKHKDGKITFTKVRQSFAFLHHYHILYPPLLILNVSLFLLTQQADSLFDYYSKESPEEAWTNPQEFH
jgi:hypothetical protein